MTVGSAPEYHYAEVMDCGHFMEVVMFLPMPDRSVLSDLDVCHLCKEEGRDFVRSVTSWRLMEPQDWQGTATPCPHGQCGPVEDASDYPGAFPMLGTVQVAPHQLGRCARCGQYYQWNVESQRWDPLERGSLNRAQSRRPLSPSRLRCRRKVVGGPCSEDPWPFDHPPQDREGTGGEEGGDGSSGIPDSG